MTDSIQLPFPPLCVESPETAYKSGETVVVTLKDGAKLSGALIAFNHIEAIAVVRHDAPAGAELKKVRLQDIKVLHVQKSRKMTRLPPSLEARGDVVMPTEKQEFELLLDGGDRLRGHTFGFRVDQHGLHLFPVNKAGEYTHVFVPTIAIKERRIGPLLGKALVKDKLVTSGAIEATLAEQQKKRDVPIGEYLKSTAVVSTAELAEALKRQKSMPQMRLGEVLVSEKIITEQQLQVALQEQAKNRKVPLGEILVSSGLVSQHAIKRTLAKKMGIPFVDLHQFQIDLDIIKLVPEDIARQHKIMPLYIYDGRLVFAIEDPMQWEPVEALRFRTKMTVDAVMATDTDIAWAIDRYYGQQRSEELVEDMDLASVIDDESEEDGATASKTEAEAQDKPIVRFVNNMLLDAVRAHASDIHVRPGAKSVDVLYRIHGELRLQNSINKNLLPPLASRIKIMGRMNIAERRRPQDGRIRLKTSDRTVDFRVSVIPTVNGESVVIRVLDKSKGLQSLEALGFHGSDLADLIDVLHRNAGIVLVTGATGSGKSSTLYAALQKLVERNLHTISIEEPVESEIAGVEQIQVNNAAGYTFALALRNILRHDPDAIMVGEIRDKETAKIALESAMTGHLVLSTLHTNDAPSTIGRLLEMEIEPYLLSAALLGVVSQRLVRLNCPHCLTPEQIAPDMAHRLGVDPGMVFHRSAGCKECGNTGNAGRTLAYEFMRATPAMRHLINEGRSAAELRKQANADGMTDLTRHAVQLAEQGKISLEQAYLVKQA